ncbi:MAG: hypothetical protein GY928_23855 [Colwellia sp.]|nr:hypothetical protein [Colwellia sp.]
MITIQLGWYDETKLPHSSQVLDLIYHRLAPKGNVDIFKEGLLEDLNGDEDITVITNSPDFINTLRYYVYQQKICYQSVVILYQEDVMSESHTVFLDSKGRFINEEGERIGFPSGFFDASLDMLVEMGG